MVQFPYQGNLDDMIGELCYLDAWPSGDSLNLFESSWIMILRLCIPYTYVYIWVPYIYIYKFHMILGIFLGAIISPGKVVEKMEWS